MTGRTRVVKVYESFVLGFCKCGCRTEINIRRTDGKLKIFECGHSQKGKLHWKYNNGIKINEDYIYIYNPDHPLTNPTYPYIAEHRLIYEHYLKILFDEDIYIPEYIDIHHIIPVKEGGTNALINLIPLTKKQHRSEHLIDTSDRYCLICNSTETYHNKKDNYDLWYKYKNGWICKKCYKKQIRNEKKKS
jgi:hypothetical protein